MSQESRIQSPILNYLRSLERCFAFKADVSTRGIPDVICCYRGLFVSFEVKAPGCHESPIQLAVGLLLDRAEAHHYVVSRLTDVKSIMRAIDVEVEKR